MSKKHFEAVAAEIRGVFLAYSEQHDKAHTSSAAAVAVGAMDACVDIAERLADVFAASNGRFDRQRFLDACMDRNTRRG